MKVNNSFILLIALLFISCNNQSSEAENESIVIEDELNKEVFEAAENGTLENWINYYKTEVDSSFGIENFNLTTVNKFSKTQGSVYGVFDKEFDKTYTEFLISSPDGQNYIDIKWSLDEDAKTVPGFSVDQGINLVNIPNKKVERIGFRGSVGWVEDAYWKDDSIIVLLETTTDKIPMITEIDLNSNESKTYVYSDTLKTISNFQTKDITVNVIN